MKQSNTPSRTILSLFALAAFGCSPLVSSQPGVPPIEMTLEQFNQGRPANFYYLADASEGYEAVCEEVLEALNEPYPGEPYAQYNEPYSKYLLRSRLSVPWVEMPFKTRQNDINPYYARYVSADLNNDGVTEDIFIRPMFLTGIPVHYFTIVEKGILQSTFDMVSPDMWAAIRDAGGRAAGDRLATRIKNELLSSFEVSSGSFPNVHESGRDYFDVIELNSSRLILRTFQSSPEYQKDTYLVLWSADESLKTLCKFRSRYTIEN